MSCTFTLTGNESILYAIISPPLILDERKEYVIGLTNFACYNSIPNVESCNSKFHFGNGAVISIPEGSYEISDIHKQLQKSLKAHDPTRSIKLSLNGNNNTLKTEIKCNEEVDFTQADSIGPLLGFEAKKLEANKLHESDHLTNIFNVNVINIDCNLVSGAYSNGRQVHTLHQIIPNVPPGYKIVETPANVIYLPLSTRIIDTINIKIADQDGRQLNLRGETVTVRLHLKQV